MRKVQAQSIRSQFVKAFVKRFGTVPTDGQIKREMRKVKKFYNTLPHNERKEFNIL